MNVSLNYKYYNNVRIFLYFDSSVESWEAEIAEIWYWYCTLLNQRMRFPSQDHVLAGDQVNNFDLREPNECLSQIGAYGRNLPWKEKRHPEN